ncbi:hemerythrin domain-containing protein [Modicisalibacter zincidurans]|uniref:Hemerythrin-like domain-containing protein n=1 Tax=Modicisalibacter zincidurans TaxID=1178777 RepID=A0ABP9RBW9_9GAMM|nr:hemerythrin domain-containing protein [Halomonas zincidurans]
MTIPLLKQLQDDHRDYDGLLCILDRQLAGACKGDMPDFALMRDILHYLTRHAERVHHALEELVFERLAIRHPEIQPTLTLLDEEHRRIRVYGEELYIKFIALSSAGPTAEIDSATTNTIQAYIELYRARMHGEESRWLTSLAETLPASDWLGLLTACDWKCDPLLRPDAAEAFQTLKSHIARNGAGYWMGQDRKADFCPLCP